MNEIELKRLSIITDGEDDLSWSKDVLSDFFFAGRECSFVFPTKVEEEIILLYTSKSIDTKKAIKLMEKLSFALKDLDEFFFLAKKLKNAYRLSDVLICNTKRKDIQKKIFLRLDTSKEVVYCDVFKDFAFLNEIINGRKVLYVTREENSHDLDNINNLDIFLVPFSSALEYQTWFEWFDLLKMKIMTMDFDIAFVSLGILSDPLCQFISTTLHKLAISKGGQDEKD